MTDMTGSMQALMELAYDQMDKWDHAGLGKTVDLMDQTSTRNSNPLERFYADLFAANLAARLDDGPGSMRSLMKALLIAPGIADERAISELHIVSARVYLLTGDYPRVFEELETAWAGVSKTEDYRQQVSCAILIASAYGKVEQWDKALEWIPKASRASRLGGLRIMGIYCEQLEAANRLDKGDEERRLGKPGEARVSWIKSLGIYEALRSRPADGEIPVRYLLTRQIDRSAVLARLDRREEAISGLRESIELLKSTPDSFTEIEVLRQLAIAYLDDGKIHEAADACERGISLSMTSGVRQILPKLLDLSALIAERRGDFAAACANLRSLLSVREELALETAQTRSLIVAIRMETDKALSQAVAERERAQSLQKDNIELRRTEGEIRALLSNKDLILKEVHHRIKNNMNAMISLLSMQGRRTDNEEAKAVLQDAGNRLLSNSVLYDKLFLSENGQSMSARDFLPDLAAEILENIPNGDAVNLSCGEVADIVLDSKVLQPIGIIVNELMVNCMKYAFPESGWPDPEIRVSLCRDEDGWLELTVSDNGIGMPENFQMAATSNFGLVLVQVLTQQLEGTMETSGNPGKGAEFTILFRAK